AHLLRPVPVSLPGVQRRIYHRAALVWRLDAVEPAAVGVPAAHVLALVVDEVAHPATAQGGFVSRLAGDGVGDLRVCTRGETIVLVVAHGGCPRSSTLRPAYGAA